MHQRRTGIILSLVSLLLTLFIIEIGFRLFVPARKQNVVPNHRPHRYYMPSAARDLRDRPHSIEKNKNTYRIAVVGDSISFGPRIQFDDTYPKRLERLLNIDEPKPSIEIINYGIPGFSSLQEVEIIKQALRENADLILLQITLNDPEYHALTKNNEAYKNNFLFDPNSGLLKHWRSLSFVLSRLHNRSTRPAYRQYFFDLFEHPDTWNNFKGSISTMKRLTDNHSVPLIAVVFPLMGVEIDKNYLFAPLHEKIHGVLDSLKINYLDLTSHFRGIPVEQLHVIPRIDYHPNEIGHAIATEAIYHWFKKTQVLSPQYFTKGVFKQRIAINASRKRHSDIRHSNKSP